MPPSNKDMQELLALTRDTNHMLHKMRRHAIYGGMIRFVIYTALLLAPIWFYMTYLNASVQKMLTAFNQLQVTGQKAQSQLGAFQQSLQEIETKIPGFASTTKTQ